MPNRFTLSRRPDTRHSVEARRVPAMAAPPAAARTAAGEAAAAAGATARRPADVAAAHRLWGATCAGGACAGVANVPQVIPRATAQVWPLW
eukprot:302541-Chlamydomonas_euryale.AAC.1